MERTKDKFWLHQLSYLQGILTRNKQSYNPHPEGLEPGGGLACRLLPGAEGPQGLPACQKAAAH